MANDSKGTRKGQCATYWCEAPAEYIPLPHQLRAGPKAWYCRDCCERINLNMNNWKVA